MRILDWFSDLVRFESSNNLVTSICKILVCNDKKTKQINKKKPTPKKNT